MKHEVLREPLRTDTLSEQAPALVVYNLGQGHDPKRIFELATSS